VAVCGDPEVAAGLVTRGARVVLCGTDGARLAASLIGLREAGRETGGRVAGFLGDLADPEVETAALAMAAELFGSDPTQPVVVRPGSEIVTSVSENCQQKAEATRPDGS
jgi:NAD(P)-dependent dehydrogenase (short-subunit alcohol dehydrogenase family)